MQVDIKETFKQKQNEFHPVVPFNAGKDRLLRLDFTTNNKELAVVTLTDTKIFTVWIMTAITTAQARYGIGGYAEQRTIYSASGLFDALNAAAEPRRTHLGIDIWGKPYTHVMAPLDGIVHSFAFNNQFGDYGATVILSHAWEGSVFYTLYGHLSLNSIKNMQEGERIKKGDVFAEFGIPVENGHWPPHLHFQIILDIGEWKGDYPGVCSQSEKEKYLANCPDPDVILQMNRYL